MYNTGCSSDLVLTCFALGFSVYMEKCRFSFSNGFVQPLLTIGLVISFNSPNP